MFVDAVPELLRLLSVGGSTGAVDIADDADDGDGVTGTLYLSGGRVTFAECSRTPDLETRLVQSGSISEARWRALVARASAGGAGLAAVAGQIRMPADLTQVLRSTVLDAAAALVPGPGPARCRYHPGRRHWAGGLVAWEVEDLLATLGTWADLTGPAGSGPADDDVPALGPAPAGAAVFLDRDDWPLLAHLDGESSVVALARRHGLALAGVRAGVRRLRDAGVCTVRTPPAPTPAPVAHPVPVVRPVSVSRPVPVSRPAPAAAPERPAPPARLPHRRPREPIAVRQNGNAAVQLTRDPVFLQRVLDGLRRLE